MRVAWTARPGAGCARIRLGSLGLRVPVGYLVDRDRVHYPADLAIVEDLPGAELEDRFARDPRAAEPTMARLVEALAAMRSHRAPSDVADGRTTPVQVYVKPTGGTSRAATVKATVTSESDPTATATTSCRVLR